MKAKRSNKTYTVRTPLVPTRVPAKGATAPTEPVAYIKNGIDFSAEVQLIDAKCAEARTRGTLVRGPLPGKLGNPETTLARVITDYSARLDLPMLYALQSRQIKDDGDKNRTPTPGEVRRRADDILKGMWIPDTGHGIIMSEDGYVNDGGHTIEAAILAMQENQNIKFFCVQVEWGRRRESRRGLDIGRKRTVAGQAEMEGISDHAMKAAAIQKLHRTNLTTGVLGLQSSHFTLFQSLREHDPLFDELIAMWPTVSPLKTSILPKGERLFVHTVLHEIDQVDARDFCCDVYGNGTKLAVTGPAYKVREKLRGLAMASAKDDRRTRSEDMSVKRQAAIFSGWNAFHHSRKTSISSKNWVQPK
jgi:hypothetical protein